MTTTRYDPKSQIRRIILLNLVAHTSSFSSADVEGVSDKTFVGALPIPHGSELSTSSRKFLKPSSQSSSGQFNLQQALVLARRLAANEPSQQPSKSSEPSSQPSSEP